ncbi:MAG: non-canonical purine NTP pyrophosphatase [Gemmatimonadales bacterium]|nr:MAG: non-canonical purine NTP pyrophosphatase [Gemmatimonadales bacterium]
MSQLLVATRSRPKLLEIQAILGTAGGLRLCTPDELGLEEDPEEESIEVFETFEENALAKARWFQARTGLPSVADDSGLEVDALGGRPGVRSKRFAPATFQRSGESRSEANIRFLLRELEGVPDGDRGARFVCVAALVGLGPSPLVHRGEVEGRILSRERGDGGFGYDPVFLDPELGRTFAELTRHEKAARSHRGRAFGALRAGMETRGADVSHG